MKTIIQWESRQRVIDVSIIANFNNLLYEVNSIYHGGYCMINLEGENNYFYTSDLFTVESSIFDRNDVFGSEIENYTEVLFMPYEINYIDMAGIQCTQE